MKSYTITIKARNNATKRIATRRYVVADPYGFWGPAALQYECYEAARRDDYEPVRTVKIEAM